MKHTFLIGFLLFLTSFVYSEISLSSTALYFKYQNNDFLKNGLYNDASVLYKGKNDNLKLTIVNQKTTVKKKIETIVPTDIDKVGSDFVYYHDMWINDTFYEEFVYDTTFVDTSYTVYDTVLVSQKDIVQNEALLSWNHRLMLWYNYGFWAKFTLFKNSNMDNSYNFGFSQIFTKQFENNKLTYNFDIGYTSINYKKIYERSVTIWDTLSYDTTLDSLYQFNPDSVVTVYHIQSHYTDYDVKKEKMKLAQLSNRINYSSKHYEFFGEADFFNDLKNKEINSYFTVGASYLSYHFSLDTQFDYGDRYLLQNYAYLNADDTKFEYEIKTGIKFYSLDKKRSVKFIYLLDKYDGFKINSFGVNIMYKF